MAACNDKILADADGNLRNALLFFGSCRQVPRLQPTEIQSSRSIETARPSSEALGDAAQAESGNGN